MSPRLPVAMTVATAILLPAPPAAAEAQTFKDGKTTEGPMDIHRVSVVNEKRLQVRIKVDDLQKKHGRSASVWIDTDPDRKGPEYFIGSGLHDSDWQIGRTEGWKVVEVPLSCPVDQRLRYADDVISWTTGAKCLGEYDEVRVSAEAADQDTRDYSPSRQHWHPWVGRS